MTEFLAPAQVNDPLSSTTLILRPLVDQEAEQTAAILATIDPWLSLGYTHEVLKKSLLSKSGDKSILICAGGEHVGLIQLREGWLFGPFISLFAIFPAYQGRGTGRRALEILEQDWCPGARNLWLTASKFNHGAVQFYQRCGFESIGEINGLVKVGFDEILMRKPLSEPSSNFLI